MPQLTMPNVGEGVTEGTVTRWLKHEGELVALDELVVEVETDKAVVEIPSPYEGRLSKILVEEGAVVPIGAPLADFDAALTSASVPIETTAADVAQPPPAVSETAPPSTLAPQATAPAPPVAADVAQPPPAVSHSPRARTRQYSPVVTRLAGEHEIDLALVRGTGIEGRVTRQDVIRYLENPSANTVAPASHEGVVGAERSGGSTRVAQPPPAVITSAANQTVVHQPPPPASSADRTLPLTPMRRTIAARMTESHQQIPAAWMSVEADVTGLVALRDRIKSDFAQTEGVALTYLPFFVQAIVGALKRHPQVNATYAEGGITLHAGQHIGIAVATDGGLVVPVLRDAGEKSIAGLAREIDELAGNARARKLTVDDMRGATLTVDNTGAFGSVLSMPILPVGQVAIITTEAIRRELRPLDDAAPADHDASASAAAFGVRAVMNLCITIDHRALDGAEAGAFMRDVKTRLECYAADDVVY